jgi:pyrroloquinoline-quinone synthase
MTEGLWDQETFLGKLREVGGRSYHDKHPFHILMNAGKLSPDAIRGWVINRFYYQTQIPVKDAAILSNCPFHEIRRLWTYRIIEHDGAQGEEGGIEAWLRLGAACGIPREKMIVGGDVAPSVRFAVDAYVHFCREKPWIIAMSSSLTELFAPDLMAKRLEAFQQHYPWVEPWGFDYFKRRLTQARVDSKGALALTLKHCDTPQLQREAVRALVFKCDLLWAVLDGIHLKYGA